MGEGDERVTNFIGKANFNLRFNSPLPTDEMLIASIKALRREIINTLRMRPTFLKGGAGSDG
jgi:hypothetical protein